MLLLEGYISNFTCARYYEYFLFKPSLVDLGMLVQVNLQTHCILSKCAY
jgi:hypothetical protein